MSRGAAALRRWPGAPIWVQILALVAGVLVVAQAVTLGLTLLLPPQPPQEHSLAEIAAALRAAAPPPQSASPLVRSLEAEPPSLESPGWVVSEAATSQLAKLLAAPEADVRLLFYAPPPLAGAAGPPPGARLSEAQPPPRLVMAGFLAFPGPGGPDGGPGGGMRPGGMGPGGMGPDGFGPPPGAIGGPPGGVGPMGGPRRAPARDGEVGPRTGGWTGGPGPWRADRPSRSDSQTESPRPSGGMRPRPDAMRGPSAGAPERTDGPARLPSGGPRPRAPLDAAVFAPRPTFVLPTLEASQAPAVRAPARPPPPEPAVEPPASVRAQAPVVEAAPAPIPVPAPEPEAAAPRPATPSPSAAPRPRPEGRALPPPVAASVFSLGRTPYVEGEFVAALRTPAGWVTVRPQPEGFPNSWQRRVLLWFGLSLAVVAPLGYLMARRLAAPLIGFADAAEQLGRDPTADLRPLAGPAEVGRAARAFNRMRERLKRYVEDRTGMVGAISHDLRTPLARMRFKLERAPPPLRAALNRDIEHMEAMITSVLSFMRDESANAPRDRVDLRSMLECIVDDGEDKAELVAGPPLTVEVDVIGVQRVFENLIDNAWKYGGGGVVSLRAEASEAVVEIRDQGPGLGPDEIEKVFRPFYRSEEAKASGKPGMGLGLAVSRATVRAHGGELVLRSDGEGLTAEVRLPVVQPARIAA